MIIKIKKIKLIHPTQVCVSYDEVSHKKEKMKKMKKKDLKRYLHSKPVPVVIGPMNKYYMIDRHHMLSALNLIKCDFFYISVLLNLSHLTIESFWDYMDKQGFVYKFDHNGSLIENYYKIPRHIKLLKNDIYRSLAWKIRELGFYEKTNVPYAEFFWANALRKVFQMPDNPSDNSIKDYYQEIIVCIENHKELFEVLPGYIPIETIKNGIIIK